MSVFSILSSLFSRDTGKVVLVLKLLSLGVCGFQVEVLGFKVEVTRNRTPNRVSAGQTQGFFAVVSFLSSLDVGFSPFSRNRRPRSHEPEHPTDSIFLSPEPQTPIPVNPKLTLPRPTWLPASIAKASRSSTTTPMCLHLEAQRRLRVQG